MSASEPMSMAGRGNGSDSCSKPGELRGRGVAKNVGPQAMLKTLNLVIRKKACRRRIQKDGTAKY